MNSVSQTYVGFNTHGDATSLAQQLAVGGTELLEDAVRISSTCVILSQLLSFSQSLKYQ